MYIPHSRRTVRSRPRYRGTMRRNRLLCSCHSVRKPPGIRRRMLDVLVLSWSCSVGFRCCSTTFTIVKSAEERKRKATYTRVICCFCDHPSRKCAKSCGFSVDQPSKSSAVPCLAFASLEWILR